MKLPDIYHSWRTMLGIALILLGSGNWIVGRFNTERYGQLLTTERTAAPDQAYLGFDDLDSGAVAVLAPLTAGQRRASYETARMDFYHATFLTGYVLVLAGLLLTFFGFLGLIRNDARRATTRVTTARVSGRLSRTTDIQE
jgi:multisubunit Na+/H+ antiporter MnhG subunit